MRSLRPDAVGQLDLATTRRTNMPTLPQDTRRTPRLRTLRHPANPAEDLLLTSLRRHSQAPEGTEDEEHQGPTHRPRMARTPQALQDQLPVDLSPLRPSHPASQAPTRPRPRVPSRPRHHGQRRAATRNETQQPPTKP